MTQATYTKALERAHAEHLTITLLESGIAHVYNPKYAEGFYTVRFHKGAAMTCNCQAGQVGTYCKHRALVHEALIARAAGHALNAPAIAERDAWNGALMTDRNWRDQYAASVLQ
jgi:hypothetical protein